MQFRFSFREMLVFIINMTTVKKSKISGDRGTPAVELVFQPLAKVKFSRNDFFVFSAKINKD